jgi:hypothetical protein
VRKEFQAQAKATSSQAASLLPAQSALAQRKCACGKSGGVSGSCEECEMKQLSLQRSSTGSSQPAAAPAIVDEVLRSPGQPVDQATRAFMEPRFGHDFNQVRIHSDARAAESASAVNALAYTVGRDIVFGAGQYRPQTSSGKELLAHELAHVVQQTGGNHFGGEDTLQRLPGTEGAEASPSEGSGAASTEDSGMPQTESPCEKSSLNNVRDLPCPGSNDRSTWLILPCEWTMFKNTGNCQIGVASRDAAGEFPEIELMEPGEVLDVRPHKQCTSLVVSCSPDCTGKGQVKWGPPCIS